MTFSILAFNGERQGAEGEPEAEGQRFEGRGGERRDRRCRENIGNVDLQWVNERYPLLLLNELALIHNNVLMTDGLEKFITLKTTLTIIKFH